MPFRPLYQEETVQVTVRVPRSKLEELDQRYGGGGSGSRRRWDPNRQHRSRTMAVALSHYLDLQSGEVQTIAKRAEQAAALKVLLKERNQAQDALRDALRVLHAERKERDRERRSLRRSLANLPTADKLRIAGFIRRIDGEIEALDGRIEAHQDLRERLRSAEVEREPDRGRVWTRGTPA